MLFYYIIEYKKLGPAKISFPIYIYMAMFPYKMDSLFSFQDILLKCALLYGLITLFISKVRCKLNPYEITFFCVAMVSSILNARSDNRSNMSLNTVNLMFVLVFSFYAYNVILTSLHLRQIMKLFVINSWILSFCVVVERYATGNVRPEVTFGNPNYYALYAYISILFYLYIFPISRINTFMYITTVGYSIYLTQSNTISLIVLVSAFYWFALYFRRRFLTRIYGASLLIIGIYYVYSVASAETINSALIQSFAKGEGFSRMSIWSGAWKVILDNLVYGVGYGNLLVQYGNTLYVTHNDYLRILGECGIPGFAVILIYLSQQYNRIVNYSHNSSLSIGLMFVAMVVFSLTHNNMNSFIFWWVISLPLYKQCYVPLAKETA